MARKKKSRSKHAKTRNPEETARAAVEHLEAKRFKDAATDYKQLLKDGRHPEWVEGLASAYAGRAAQLAGRGMVKEAIALWQNRAEACDTDLADPRYLQWLIAADRTREIARLYRQDAAALAGVDGLATLQARLAAAALADGGELIEQLPADDPVVRDFATANTALIAYADGDDETLQAALGRIAFRSPYRDFRQLLKALVRHETDPAAAAELVARGAGRDAVPRYSERAENSRNDRRTHAARGHNAGRSRPWCAEPAGRPGRLEFEPAPAGGAPGPIRRHTEPESAVRFRDRAPQGAG